MERKENVRSKLNINSRHKNWKHHLIRTLSVSRQYYRREHRKRDQEQAKERTGAEENHSFSFMIAIKIFRASEA
jgi:hypothetical protein